MQIGAIVLYGTNGERRILPFNIGSVNKNQKQENQ